jgi:hypothetical protein
MRRRLLRRDAPRASCTHALANACWSLRFCALAEVGPTDSARIKAARFNRDAPPFDASLNCSASPARGSCAGDFLRPAFRYPLGKITWPGRAPFGVEACFGFRPVNLADDKRQPVVTRVTVSLSTYCTRRRSWGFRLSLRRFDPADGRVRVIHSLEPTCRLSNHPSQWFCCATGRPG